VLVVICYPTIGQRSMVPNMAAAVKYTLVPTYVPTVNMQWAQTIKLINAILIIALIIPRTANKMKFCN